LPEVDNLVEALIFSFETLGEETIGAIASLTGLLADLIQKSTRFVARISDLGDFLAQFKETITALSELGLAIGSGLIPVFTVFSNVMQTLADTLNQLDDEVLGNIVTFTALVVAFSRVSGVVSTLVTIIPNLAVGFASLGSEVKKADTTFKAFQATVVGTNARIAHFLSQISVFSGVSALVASLGGMGERLRQIAFRSSSATARFEALALGTNVTAQQLYELAVAGELTKDMMQGLQEEAEDVDEDFRKLQLRLALTKEQFEDIDGDVDIDVDEFDRLVNQDTDELLGDASGNSLIKRLFGGEAEASEAAQKAAKAVSDQFNRNELGHPVPMGERIGDQVRIEEAAESIDILTTAQFDYNRVVSSARDRLDNLSLKTMSLTGANNSLTNSFLTVASGAMKAAVAFNKYGISLISTITKSIYALISQRSLSAALNVVRNSMIAAAISTFIQNSALLTYIASVLTATGSTYAFIAALSKLTLGAFAIISAIGAAAAGIITNFDKIKGAGSGLLSGLMPLFGALKEILLTVFVETWNVVVAAFSSLKTLISPFTDIIRDFIGIFGILGGSTEDSAGSFSILGAAVSALVSVIKFAAQVLENLFAVIGVVGKGLFTIMLLPLKVLVTVLRSVAEGVRFLATAFADLVGGALSDNKYFSAFIEALKTIKELFFELPTLIENFTNSAIDSLNEVIKGLNELPFVEIGTVSRVELTGGGLETSRQELSRDTERVGDDLARVAPNVINMKEENNQTVNQSIDADPEDKSTVSRVVEDAIERANRFERTRAGQ